MSHYPVIFTIRKLVPQRFVTISRMSHYPGSHYQKSIVHAVWFIRDGFIRDAFQRLLDLLEILRDEV